MTPADRRAVVYAVCWSALILLGALAGRAW